MIIFSWYFINKIKSLSNFVFLINKSPPTHIPTLRTMWLAPCVSVNIDGDWWGRKKTYCAPTEYLLPIIPQTAIPIQTHTQGNKSCHVIPHPHLQQRQLITNYLHDKPVCFYAPWKSLYMTAASRLTCMTIYNHYTFTPFLLPPQPQIVNFTFLNRYL